MKKYATCQDCVDLLFDYLDSSLDPETLKLLDEHFAGCPPCVNFLKTYKSSKKMGKAMCDQRVRIPMEMEERLKSFLHQELKAG